MPLFDFDAYFPGKWTFEWDVPESPLGPAGRIEGTTTYRKVSDGVYEAVTNATGPGGSFSIKESIKYQREQKVMSRDVTDSRGFTYTQSSTIGGDLGGFYNIFFESKRASAILTGGGESMSEALYLAFDKLGVLGVQVPGFADGKTGARPPQDQIDRAVAGYLGGIRLANGTIRWGYLASLGLKGHP